MGRAPTSGNCHTCRQRRVKCDKAQPECARCVRGGFVCQGYETVLRMQNHAAVAGAAPGSVRLAKVQNVSSYPSAQKAGGGSSAGADETTKRQRAVPQTAASRAAAASRTKTPPSSPKRARDARAASMSLSTSFSIDSDPSTPGDNTPTTSGSHSQGSRGTVPREPRDETALWLPQELSLIGFVDDMAFSYFFQSYSWINMHSLLLQDAALRSHFLAEDGQDAVAAGANRLAQDSLRALCYGLLGRDKHAPSLQVAGRRVYGKAIAQLRATITTSSKTELATLVKPISLLGSYLIAVEKDLRLTHHAGLAHILEVCGPEYFQSPDLLPIFESVRMTLIADAVIRRQKTFLEKPEWKTVPWALRPKARSMASRLLDILATITGITQGVMGVRNDRIQWVSMLSGGQHDVPQIEQLDTVADLQARTQKVHAAAAEWYNDWVAGSPDLAPRVLAWAYAGAGDDTYRPGIFGAQGPDIFYTSLADSVMSGWSDDLFSPATSNSAPGERPTTARQTAGHYDPDLVAAHMQDAALYTTVIVWAARIDKYLAGAARSPTSFNFFSKPFYTTCSCLDTMPPLACEALPPFDANVDQSIAWNASTSTLTAAPMRCIDPARLDTSWSSPLSSIAAAFPSYPSSDASTPPPPQTAPSTSPFGDDILIPGDIRFVAHMRILSWLCARLPATRPHVLGALAAVGLAHCTHDVRPAEGHAEIAAVALARAFDSTAVEGASGILLRRYDRERTPGVA